MLRSLLPLFLAVLSAATAVAQTSSERAAVQLFATVSTSPAAVTLNWTSVSSTSSITIYRKLRTATSWGGVLAAPASSATQYVDNTVSVGIGYEYKVVRVSAGVTGTGYISTGVQVPVVEQRGKIVLLVDNTYAAPLATELTQLQRDLQADGWGVVRVDVSPTDPVTSVRNTIMARYNADPSNVKALYIIGHVPVPYSGNLNPDGHSTHLGAWPCDAYYGELNGTWTDASVNSTGGYTYNWNVPGDGRFDQSDLPSPMELQVGRLDLSNLPAFPQTAVELTRAYLIKAHNYKVRGFTPQVRGLMFDNLQWVSNPLAASGWRSMAPLVGPSTISAANQNGTPFHTLVNGQSHLWTYSSGGGMQATVGTTLTFNGAANVGTTQDYAASTGGMDGVFNMAFGSYFGDWDNMNNFLRAPLANGDALTNVWSSIPAWYFHHMGMGDPIGTSVLATMNNTGLYTPLTDGWQGSIGRVHLGLMGDPSLRQYMVAPPTNLVVSNAGGTCLFSWSPSAEPVQGYYVYQIATDGTITRVVSNLITGTSHQAASVPFVSGAEYMVRAVKLQTTPSGSYFDLSLGARAVTAGTTNDCLGVSGGTALPGTACNDGNACTVNDLYNASCVCVGTAASATITPSGPTALCTGASVVLNANTGTGLTYIWRRDGNTISGATASSFTATQAGSYTVIVIANGCSVTSAATVVTVGSTQTATLTAAGYTTFCQGATVTLNANTGTGLSYAWRRDGVTISGATASSYIANATGSYTVTVSNGGCSATSNGIAVTAVSPLATITASGPTALCSGGSVTLNANTGTGLTYAWFKDGATISGATASSCTVSTPGNYTVMVTNGACPTTSAAVAVTVGGSQTATLTAAGSTALCAGGSVTLNANTGTGLTYVWRKDGVTISGATASSYSANAAGNYTVVVTSGACSATSTALAVTVGGSQTATITAAGYTTFCQGATVTLNANTGSGLSYAWSKDGVTISGATASSYIANASGNYTVTVSNGGCAATSNATVVNVVSPSATITASGPTSLCTGGSVTLSASTGTGYTYAWWKDGAPISGATAASYTATTAGSYAVVVTSSGCPATSTPTVVTVGGGQAATITAAGSTALCSGGSVTLNANTGNGLSYVWRKNGVTISGATASSYTANSAGGYTVTVNNGGCSATSAATTVTLNVPTASITPSGPTAICTGGSVTLNANTGTGLSYVWRKDGVTISGATASSYSASAVGNYTVVVTSGGCSATSAAVGVTVGGSQAATITAGGYTTFCQGATVTLSANTGTGLSYVWRKDGVAISGATGSIYIANATGNYTVTVSNGNCTTTSAATAVTVINPTATITAGGSTTLCGGGSVALNANTGTGFTYVWRRNGLAISGATASSYTATTAGNYTVVVNNNGCVVTSSATSVTTGGTQVATITAGGYTTFCQGATVTLNANTGTGLSYAWRKDGVAISGATASSYIANATGNYAVTVSNGGCSATSAATAVTVNDAPTVTCTNNSANATVSASATGGSAPYAYTWNTSPVQSSATATVSTSGSYTVTVTGANGCTGNATTTIVLNDPCAGIRTETQATWGSAPTTGMPSAYLSANFASAFPSGLTIGCSRKLVLTSAGAITTFLPSLGTAATLPSGTLTDPTIYSNAFAGELVAVKLAVRFDEMDPAFSTATALLRDMVVSSGTFAGWTVQQLIDEADRKIGGCWSLYSRTSLTTALQTINTGYAGGVASSGYLVCPGTRMAVQEAPVAEEQDDLTLTAWPNPANGPVTFELAVPDNVEGTPVLEVRSLTGALVHQRDLVTGAEEGVQRIAWNVEGLPGGLYLCAVSVGDRRTAIRLVVQ